MKDRMKKCINLSVICLAAASLLAACSEDELVDGGSLPAGLYPVEIASVTISDEDDVQPWEADSPQTRAEESGDGRTIYWQDGDIFYVKFSGSDNTGRIRFNGNTSTTTLEQLYWRSASQEETLISWFTQPETANGSTMDFSDQSDSLAYVCREEQTVKYNDGDIIVNLKHQLAKVRVYVQGTGYTGNATGVTINNMPTTCTVAEGKITETSSTTTGSIKMYKTMVNNTACFEANVLPDTLGTDNTFTVTFSDGSKKEFTRTEKQTLVAGKVFTANLRLQASETKSIDLSKQSKTYEINGSGTYFFYCSEESNKYGIKVASGNPQIYLANVNIDMTTGNAIDITGGSPTLNVQGNVNVQSSGGAGIYVSSGSVTLTASVISGNLITARGGNNDANVYPGIGGAYRTTINISNLNVYAYGSEKDGNYSPAIGAVQPIGESSPNPPRVNLSNCEIWAYRVMIPGDSWYMRSYADHIGQGGNADNPHGYANGAQVNLGSGSNSGSRVYCYSDDRFNGEY